MVIKDGKEVVEWQRVDLTYHADGNVGIGTTQDASAPVMGEPVEHLRVMMSNQEPEANLFAHSTIEWARVDKDLNVTHLDMELCAKGPQNVYTALAMAIWNKAVQEEREACAKACEEVESRAEELWDKFAYPEDQGMASGARQCATAIRARVNK